MERTKAQKALDLLDKIEYFENDEELQLLYEIKGLIISNFSEQPKVTDLGCVETDSERVYNWFYS
jgi:hypothetical protein